MPCWYINSHDYSLPLEVLRIALKCVQDSVGLPCTQCHKSLIINESCRHCVQNNAFLNKASCYLSPRALHLSRRFLVCQGVLGQKGNR